MAAAVSAAAGRPREPGWALRKPTTRSRNWPTLAVAGGQ